MNRELHKIDATDKVPGRLASQIAVFLQGKHKIEYQPHTDCGDLVVVANVAKMRFTGKKLDNKIYYRHTGYPGGIRETKLSDIFKNKPELLFKNMVSKMLPKNKLRSRIIKRLTFTKTSDKK